MQNQGIARDWDVLDKVSSQIKFMQPHSVRAVVRMFLTKWNLLAATPCHQYPSETAAVPIQEYMHESPLFLQLMQNLQVLAKTICTGNAIDEPRNQRLYDSN